MLNKLKSLAILSLLISLIGCEAPRDKRSLQKSNDTGIIYSNTGTSSSNSDGSTVVLDGTTGDSSSGNDGSSSTGATIPSEISHCSWAADGKTGFSDSSSHLGEHTLCVSSTDSTTVYIQANGSLGDSQMCFFPTTNSGGSSTYIGEPRCLIIENSSNIYKIKLYINRPGYTNATMTGVMVMKDKAFYYNSPFNQYALSPDAYIFCSQFLDQYGNDSYCTAFKSVGQYTYKLFSNGK